MDLFHASCKKYEVSQILCINDFDQTEYYKNAINRNMGWIDSFLDKNKPDNAPERKKTLFAFDSIVNCKAFIKNRCKGQIYYYKIRMKNPIACPMCLTDALAKNDENKNKKIAKEYWKPIEDWKFLEYLSMEMEILAIMDEANFMEFGKGLDNYLHDLDIRKKY